MTSHEIYRYLSEIYQKSLEISYHQHDHSFILQNFMNHFEALRILIAINPWQNSAARAGQLPPGAPDPPCSGDAQAQAGRGGSRLGSGKHRSRDAGEATDEGVGHENWFGRKGFETLCLLERFNLEIFGICFTKAYAFVTHQKTGHRNEFVLPLFLVGLLRGIVVFFFLQYSLIRQLGWLWHVATKVNRIDSAITEAWQKNRDAKLRGQVSDEWMSGWVDGWMKSSWHFFHGEPLNYKGVYI